MAEPERCGKPYGADSYGSVATKCERPAGHVPPAPEGCGPAERCHAGRDGDCIWQHCPQVRDGEPTATGRHCPLDLCPRCGSTWDVHDEADEACPVHGPENAGGGAGQFNPAGPASGPSAPEPRVQAFIDALGANHVQHVDSPAEALALHYKRRAEAARRTAPERPPAEDDEGYHFRAFNVTMLRGHLCSVTGIAFRDAEALANELFRLGVRVHGSEAPMDFDPERPPGEGSGSEQDGAAHEVARPIDRDALVALFMPHVIEKYVGHADTVESLALSPEEAAAAVAAHLAGEGDHG